MHLWTCAIRTNVLQEICSKAIGFKHGFKQGLADPCLLTSNDEYGIIFIAIYVDHCYCCGTRKAIEDTIKGFKNQGFTLKVKYDMTDYLSCCIKFSNYKKKAIMCQPHLIKKLKKKFGVWSRQCRSTKHLEHQIKVLQDQKIRLNQYCKKSTQFTDQQREHYCILSNTKDPTSQML